MDSPCDSCFVRRVKCDRKTPCQACLARSQTCSYLRVRKRPGPKGPRPATDLKIKMIQHATSQAGCTEMGAVFETPRMLSSQDLPISVTAYCTVLDLFQGHLYEIWPIVDAEDLKSQLRNYARIDPMKQALAAAVCAATLVQMRLWLTPDPCPQGISLSAERFAKECLYLRLENSYNQEPSLPALVTSIFLHMYYANRDLVTPATITLREAITYADLMHLGQASIPGQAQSKQWQLELRCYWILFVTERTFCIQHDLPITLHRIPDLPTIERNTPKGDVYAGFCALVQIFLHLQQPLVASVSASKAIEGPEVYSKSSILDIQRCIQVKSAGLELTSEIQYVDILTTSAWVRSLLWQYSASRFMLSSGTSVEPLSFEYPLSIAKDYLESLSNASIESLRSHGYGMEIKLLQIANSALDIVLCMPNILSHETCRLGPLDAVVAIEQLLSKVGGTKSQRLGLLHQRLTHIPSTTEMPSTIEFPVQEEEDVDSIIY